MDHNFKEVKSCERCGSVVSPHRLLDGTVVYLPVSDAFLPAALHISNVDTLLHDRLFRAEKIIVDLRQKVRELSEKK